METPLWADVLLRSFLLILVWRHVTVVKILVKATPTLIVGVFFWFAVWIALVTHAWFSQGPDFANKVIQYSEAPFMILGALLGLQIIMWVFAGFPICIRSFWKLATEKRQ